MSKRPEPPDIREELTRRRNRRLRENSREPIPWLWLGLGAVVTLVAIGLAFLLARSFLNTPPLEVALPTPTVIRLTAPPTAPPTATPELPTPTPIPTFTPVPTVDNSVAPEVVTVGFYAEVAGTDGLGVNVRGGPTADNIRLLTAPEGEVLLVIGGPEENGRFVWWQVRLADGTEGWVVADYLTPAPAP
jgi:hypothetical protein